MILVMCLVQYSTKSDVSAKYKRGCVQRKSHGSSLAPSTLEPWELLSCWEGKGELLSLEQNLLCKVAPVYV